MTTTGVVVGCYNHERYVANCIESALSQTSPPDRIVVVDDNSSDGSRAVVESYRSEGVELIVLERVGPSVVFNTGVEAIGTDIVAIISADDACLPDRLERQQYLIGRYDLDLVLGLPIIIDQIGAIRSDALAPEFFVPFESGSGPLFRQLFDVGNFLCAATATFRRDAFLSLGGFHPGLLQLQDFHLWLRWSWRRMLLTTERFSFYRKSAGSLSGVSNDQRMHSERLWVYRHVFDEVPDFVMSTAFSDGFATWPDGHKWVRNALIYLGHPDPAIYQIGCEVILDALADPGALEVLRRQNVTLQDVFAWVGRADASGFGSRRELVSQIVEMRGVHRSSRQPSTTESASSTSAGSTENGA
jgi:glycosyltransferase involved in cell wall biosynthesis